MLLPTFRAAAVLVAALVIIPIAPASAVSEYTIVEEFDGCEHGRIYPLEGGGVLECLEYRYFYAYRPTVVARGRDVLLIDDQQVSARLHNGGCRETRVDSDFEGCEFDKVIPLLNGLVFQCQEYHYHYEYAPEVMIVVIEGRAPTVIIAGRPYAGQLFRIQ
jgi:hypothetical protein